MDANALATDAREETARDLEGGSEAVSVRLKDRYVIWPDAPLSHLTTPTASAYAAIDAVDGNEGLFALVCDSGQLPRYEILVTLADVRSTALMRLVDSGYVWWPPDERRRLVVIYERPAGSRLVQDYRIPIPSFNEIDAIRGVLAPLLSALTHLNVFGIIHRNIRPTNLYFADVTKKTVMLGECISAPPAFNQPVLFESIESIMAARAGRGIGSRANDIYSLGVTLLYLLLGRHPAPHLDDEALLAAKLTQGSFTALVARTPIPTALREPLRGMLQDDPAQRWGLSDLEGWVSERRLKPFQVVQSERATRPFNFEGQNYYSCRSLAQAITRSWRSDTMTERKVDLGHWLERSMGDSYRREAIERAYDQRLASNSSIGGESSGRAMLNARIGVALDPLAPLRYKNFAAMVDGFGPMLATHFQDSNALQEFTEIVRGGLPTFWLDVSRDNDRESGQILSQFRRMNSFLRDPRPGFGPERCLYEMNPGQHCLSPLVERECVVEIGSLLPALEKVSKGMSEGTPFDRHIAAFVAARCEDDITPVLTMIANRARPLDSAIGLLSFYTSLQWRYGPESLPELTRWIMTCSEVLMTNYHHRTARKRAEAELPRILKHGSIVELHNFLLNGDLRRQDEAGFAEAAVTYNKAETEIAFLESGGATNPARARELGHRIAAIASIGIALLAIALLTIAGL